ncbi:MAG: T9SS type A sorting domain-containing protein [Fidelibacterota bacterium]
MKTITQHLSAIIFIIPILLVSNEIVLAQPDTLWTKTFGGSGDDAGYWVEQTTDGGYIITGYTNRGPPDELNVVLIKTDGNVEALWINIIGTSGDDWGNSVQETTDGGYIIAGVLDNPWTEDVWLIKTDSNGDTLWTRIFGGSDQDLSSYVQQTTDGGHIITGYTASYGFGGDLWLIKTDSIGDTLWTRTFYVGEPSSATHLFGFSVQQTTDGGYIITGFITGEFIGGISDVLVIKTDSNGDSLWTMIMGGTGRDQGRSIQQTSDNGYIIAGHTDSYGAGETDVWLIRVAPDTGLATTGHDPKVTPHSFLLHQNYPNPFNAITAITYQLPKATTVNLSIYNVAGHLVETLVNERKNAGYHSVIWNASGIGSGLYFYQIKAGEYTETKKCVILK